MTEKARNLDARFLGNQFRAEFYFPGILCYQGTLLGTEKDTLRLLGLSLIVLLPGFVRDHIFRHPAHALA